MTHKKTYDILKEKGGERLIKSYKVKLHPNKTQEQLFIKSFGLSRFIYNWCLNKQNENYKLGNKSINRYELKKDAIKLKEEYLWMKELPAKVIHQAVFDSCDAYEKFFKKLSQYPRFKSKKDNHQSFWNPPDVISFTQNKVKLQKIGLVKMAEKNRIPIDTKYYNPRITFDGLNYWLSVGVDVDDKQINNISKTEPIGIDLGVKTLLTLSNGETHNRVNIKKEQKKLKRLQRKASRLYIQHKGRDKSKNLIKLEKEISKQHKRITNIQIDNIHKITKSIIDYNPEFIALEDLNVKGMMKNKCLSRVLNECKFYEVRRQFEYKGRFYGVDIKIVDRWYPSSKTCSCCGNIKKDLKLNDRQYVCQECGLSIDRDLNASINIKNYKKGIS